MSSIDPFRNNSNYKSIFQVRSEVTRCEIQEVIEMYQEKETQEYIIFRYQCINNTMPFRMSHRFTTCISIEVTDDGSKSSLFLTLAYKDYLTVFQRVNVCCGSKTYVLKVEEQLYRALF
jgi:hypothetical protein